MLRLIGYWRNEQHRAQWGMTLTRYTETIRSMPINMIGTAEVVAKRDMRAMTERLMECYRAEVDKRRGRSTQSES